MKPEGPVLDRELIAHCVVLECGRTEVDEFVRKRHYLLRWPGVVMASYALLRDYMAVGVCVYALPPRETSKRYGLECWELARLWIDDSMPANSETWFIAKTISKLKKRPIRPEILVSYADPSQNHSGLIYKAGNWKSDGRTDQERKSPRCDYWVGDKKYSRRSHVPDGQQYERRPRVSKFRFIYEM